MGRVPKAKRKAKATKKMESQHLNALSLQSLFYIADTKMHEIDLECLATLPQTIRALQAELRELKGAPPEPQTTADAAETPESPVAVEPEIRVSAAPTFSRRPARASVPLAAA
jgi:pyruvate dehydrogenase complex dehydrogenase (E1) component